MASLEGTFGVLALQAIALFREQRMDDLHELLAPLDDVQCRVLIGALVGIAAPLSEMAGLSAQNVWDEAENVRQSSVDDELRDLLDSEST